MNSIRPGCRGSASLATPDMTRFASVPGCATAPTLEGLSEPLCPHPERPRPYRAIREDGPSVRTPMRTAWEVSGVDSHSAPLQPLSCLAGATQEVSRRFAANLPRLANPIL